MSSVLVVSVPAPRFDAMPSVVPCHQNLRYAHKDLPLVDRHPPKPGGEDWLVNAQEQLVVQFKPDNPSPHAEWVSVRTFSWTTTSTSAATRRRMLRHDAIDAWKQMQKTGWHYVQDQCTN